MKKKLKRCKTPQRRNPETNRCKKPCRRDQATNPRTKRCVLKTYLAKLANEPSTDAPIRRTTKKAITASSKKATTTPRRNSSKTTTKVSPSKSSSLRRSRRVPGASALQLPSVVKLLRRIKTNSNDTVVLKLHHYLPTDASTAVIDAVLDALMSNTKCQALYIQNFNNGCRDKQVKKLVRVLQQGHIWAVNAGENYNVTRDTWQKFAKELETTNLTHAYISEHRISGELKKAIMATIRLNRKKHTKHIAVSNIDVIKQVTHMWWNPFASKTLQAQLQNSTG